MFIQKLLAAITCFLYGSNNIFSDCEALENSNTRKFSRICYYTNWPAYRDGKGYFIPEYIHYEHCTVIAYSFVFLEENKVDVKITDKNLDVDKGFYQQVTALREKGLHVVVVLGGWTDSKKKYSEMMADETLRKKFCKNLALFLHTWRFGGVDVNLEHPGTYPNDPTAGDRPQDKANYILFLNDLRCALDEIQRSQGLQERLTLSIAVSGNRAIVDKGFNVPAVSELVDWLGIMTYDCHTKAEPNTGLVAPFSAMDGEPEQYREFNVQSMMDLWISKGAPKEKLVVGIPFYGRSFKLVDENVNGIYAPASGDPEPGQFTKESGALAFFEILDKVQIDKWTVVHEESLGSYAFKGDQWVGYNDARDAALKAEYVRKNGFHGVMYWSLEADCFQISCKCSLLTTIHKVLTGEVSYEAVENCT